MTVAETSRFFLRRKVRRLRCRDSDRDDFKSCPRHKDKPRQFECTRLVTADQVKAVIQSILGFARNGSGACFTPSAAIARAGPLA